MKLIRKIGVFLSLPSYKKLLFIEAFIMLAWGRILKMVPFSKVAPTLGEQMQETSLDQVDNKEVLKNVSQAIHIMSKYTFWESQCLVKAIAGMKMLQRRNIESTLYLGTGRDEIGKLAAHAWLRSGPYYISGREGMERFAVVAKFANRVNEPSSMEKGKALNNASRGR